MCMCLYACLCCSTTVHIPRQPCSRLTTGIDTWEDLTSSISAAVNVSDIPTGGPLPLWAVFSPQPP